jgi:hypothetical protein
MPVASGRKSGTRAATPSKKPLKKPLKKAKKEKKEKKAVAATPPLPRNAFAYSHIRISSD